MSALPRPDLPPGPHRELVDRLHELHHRAGWPSLRTLARETAVSHTTVSKAFSRPALPSWGTLELLVEAMDGDTGVFHALWLAASTSAEGSRPAPRIAGRRTELDVVRHHLESGSGLLLVTGEAGIGKSTLVRAAADAAAAHVATGHCRPLSTPVSLMPMVEVLRDLMSRDDRSWSDAVIRASPAWVWPTLAPLLPELGTDALTGPQDFGRQRLMSAVITLVEAFHAERPLALWLEDLPWADSATLDLVEMLDSHGSRLPVVATWRTEDPDTTPVHTQWWDRVAARTSRVSLVPLSRAETADQLALMDGVVPAAARVDQIFRRSQGQPLFTEHLASGGQAGDALPDVLAGALSRRLDLLDGDDWLLVRTLGIADRALTVEQLVRAAGVQADPVPALRALVRQRLVASVDDKVQLRHPLLGEAVRAMLVPGEARGVHVGIAVALEELSDPPAAEVAGHWQAARRPADEMRWRIRAALAADARFARREAFAEWSRVLELWGVTSPPDGEAEVDLAQVLVRRIESAIRAGHGVEAVGGLIEEAMATPLPELGRAAVLLRAGDIECGFGDVALGLRLIDEAVAIQSRHAPTREAARVLEVRVNILGSLGRNEELGADIARGLDIAAALDAPEIARIFLAQSAWAHVVDHDPGGARDLAWQAIRAVDPDRDPAGTIRVGASATEVLLAVGASAQEIAEAATDAVVHTDRWQVLGLAPDGLYSDVAEAYLRAGDVTRAAEWIEPRVRGVTGAQLRRSRRASCAVDVRRGELASALAMLEHLEAIDQGDHYAVSAALRNPVHAEALLWSGKASEAGAHLALALEVVSTNDLALESAWLLAMCARTEADLVQSAAPSERHAALARVELMRATCVADPFGPDAYGADLAAHTATWRSELQRIVGRDSAGPWAGAAAEWDSLTRPHDAAYCRWRAAQCALRDGQGTVAARLLKHAARDAKEHVPLARAIARTAGGG
ncbi:AAA ATPase domain-containing protein [Nocardioides alpinus]|uniref:AAA ATPase domain-containing protein n=1 Tax=Nocardioides alpinus TaxID=748909 RepID=A0A1I0VNA3_9ACTN|nr:AAA family ATPase [Nocardioides alpinus]PKH37355.1 hypothetical protein CXG46_17995 [Nocardioides alpinus]SFA77473.1 AAA ATPase domain-containing protein [Nocardioides alpinus]